jgi:hypothetical protein
MAAPAAVVNLLVTAGVVVYMGW